jgi:two-component system cell cycle response regulator
MRGLVRDIDVVCRWGGDEFVVIIPNSSLADAQAKARKIQARAFGEFVLNRGSEGIRVSVSAGAGVAEYKSGETAMEFFERADQLLLEEKRYRHHRNPALVSMAY